MEIKPLDSQDIENLVAIWNRNLPADPITPQRLEAHILLDPNFRQQFALTAWESTELCGFVLGICGQGIHFPATLEGTRAWILAMAVDGAHRGQGIGSALLAELETRFRKARKTSVWIAPYPTAYIVPGIDQEAYADGLRFFQARGYQVAYRALAMDTPLWPMALPSQLRAEVAAKEQKLAGEGISFHTYHPRWLLAFRAFLRTALPWDWERLALHNLRRIHQGTFFPRQFQLAVHQQNVIGYCQYEGAHLGPFGVADGYQRRGIGTVLLARTLQSIAGSDHHSAWVLWTGGDAARLYARFGFQTTRTFAVLHKELPR